jgi:PAS domain S-box-containing protein
MSNDKRKLCLLLGGLLLMGGVFVWDTFTPLGIADCVLYVVVVLFTLWHGDARYTVVSGIIATALIVIGYFLSPPVTTVLTLPVVNRTLSIVCTWATVFLIYRFKQSESKVSFYRDRLEMLFRKMEEGLILTDPEGRIKMANPRALKYFQWSEKDLQGRRMDSVLYPFPPVAADEPVHARRSDGTEFAVQVHSWAFGQGDQSHMIYFIQDITQRLKQEKELQLAHEELMRYSEQLQAMNENLEHAVEARTVLLSETVDELEKVNRSYRRELVQKAEAIEALHESQRLLETMADNFPDGSLSLIDRNGRYVFVRGKELQKLGHDPASLIGSEFMALRYPEIRDEVQELLKAAFRGYPEAYEFYYPEADSYYRINLVPLNGSDGEVHELLAVAQNINAQKEAERCILDALEKEKMLNEVKSRFVTTASHEFRTPLGAILSSASLIKLYPNEADGPKREKHVNRIISSVQHLTDILNDFLSIGRIEEGKVRNEPEDFPLAEFLDELQDEAYVKMKPGQTLRMQSSYNGGIIADKHLLKTVLINLLSNAVKYSKEGQVIEVTADAVGNHLRISVRDYGIGIPLSDQAHLFETFYRASNVENIKGSGMGLHIARHHIEAMGGTIAFSSETGKGTTFTITVPLVPEVTEAVRSTG